MLIKIRNPSRLKTSIASASSTAVWPLHRPNVLPVATQLLEPTHAAFRPRRTVSIRHHPLPTRGLHVHAVQDTRPLRREYQIRIRLSSGGYPPTKGISGSGLLRGWHATLCATCRRGQTLARKCLSCQQIACIIERGMGWAGRLKGI